MVSNIFFSMVLLFMTTLTACVSKVESNSVVLDYDEFGPSAMSYSLVGYPWWQWLPEGGSNPKARYDIKVVVYKDVPLKRVEAVYPVSENQEKDYRYVTRDDAIQYLDKSLEMVREPGLNDLNLEKTLMNTQAKLKKLDE